MAKTKRMFMGGAAKAVSQAAKVAPKAGPAGMQGLGQAMRSNPQMAQNLGKAAAMQGLGQAMGPGLQGGPPPQSKFMALRDGAAGAPTMGAGMQGLGQAMTPPPKAGPAGMQGLGQAMGSMPQGSPAQLGQLGAAMGKTMGGMGMKSGGKVSSASSRADGCATKGKTKGRFV